MIDAEYVDVEARSKREYQPRIRADLTRIESVKSAVIRGSFLEGDLN